MADPRAGLISFEYAPSGQSRQVFLIGDIQGQIKDLMGRGYRGISSVVYSPLSAFTSNQRRVNVSSLPQTATGERVTPQERLGSFLANQSIREATGGRLKPIKQGTKIVGYEDTRLGQSIPVEEGNKRILADQYFRKEDISVTPQEQVNQLRLAEQQTSRLIQSPAKNNNVYLTQSDIYSQPYQQTIKGDIGIGTSKVKGLDRGVTSGLPKEESRIYEESSMSLGGYINQPSQQAYYKEITSNGLSSGGYKAIPSIILLSAIGGGLKAGYAFTIGLPQTIKGTGEFFKNPITSIEKEGLYFGSRLRTTPLSTITETSVELLVGGKILGVYGKALPVKLETAKIGTEETTLYRGIGVTTKKGGNPLIGYSNDIVFGQPEALEFNKLISSSREIEIPLTKKTQVSILQNQIDIGNLKITEDVGVLSKYFQVPKSEITPELIYSQKDILKNVYGTLEVKKTTARTTPELPSTTERLSEVPTSNLYKDLIKKENLELFGSGAQEAQIPKDLRRSIHDLDIEASRFQNGLKLAEKGENILKASGEITRPTPQIEGAVDVLTPKGFQKAFEIKGGGLLSEEEAPATFLSESLKQKPIVEEQYGLKLSRLSEQGLRKASSITTLRAYNGEFFFSPKGKRFKDIADFSRVQEELFISQGSIGSGSYLNIKNLEKAFPKSLRTLKGSSNFEVGSSEFKSPSLFNKGSPFTIVYGQEFVSPITRSSSRSISSSLSSGFYFTSPISISSKSISPSRSISSSLSKSPSFSPSISFGSGYYSGSSGGSSYSPSPSPSFSFSPSISPSISLSPSLFPSISPSIYGGGGSGGRRKRYISRRELFYTPSLKALGFNITASKVPRFPLTGIETRPIIKNKRKRRSKKK